MKGAALDIKQRGQTYTFDKNAYYNGMNLREADQTSNAREEGLAIVDG